MFGPYVDRRAQDVGGCVMGLDFVKQQVVDKSDEKRDPTYSSMGIIWINHEIRIPFWNNQHNNMFWSNKLPTEDAIAAKEGLGWDFQYPRI